MIKKAIFTIFCGSLLALSNNVFAENTARAIFMSTAESTIMVSQEEKDKKTTQQSVNKPKTKQVATKKQTDYAYGMQFQVYVYENGKEKLVNPATYVFREGDRFRIQIRTNTPGIIMALNRDPLNRETFLGGWPIERPFSPILIPAEGYFEFYGPKGDDLLYILFMPCRVEKDLVTSYANYNTARSIRVVSDDRVENIKLRDDVYKNLPSCGIIPQEEKTYFEEKRRKYTQEVSYSRSIRVAFDEHEGAGYAFSSATGRERTGNVKRASTDMVILNVIKLRYR